MATMTIRLPDAKHAPLKQLAERQGVSLNRLIEEWSSMALAQFDAETRFRLRAPSEATSRAVWPCWTSWTGRLAPSSGAAATPLVSGAALPA